MLRPSRFTLVTLHLGKSHRRLQSLDFRNIWSQEWGLALQL